jgi:hypothetical protein
VLNGATDNTEINKCAFYSFTGPAVQHAGTSLRPLSGNKVFDSFFPGNATTGSLGQLAMQYSNDHFVENNQFGVTSLTAPFPAYGVSRTNCENGSFWDNYIWSNVVGMSDTNCAYDRIIANRYE